MYIVIPDFFLVPVYYCEEVILNLKRKVVLQKCNYNSGYINKSKKRKNPVIGISLPDLGPRFNRDKKAMEDYAALKDATLKIESANFDIAKQASQVDDLISQGINVLILAPVYSPGAADMVEKAHKAGIKVIDYDRFIENSDLDLYISFNNIRVGELQGQYLVRNVPKGRYIIMSGDLRDNNSKLFKEGAMEYIQPLIYKRDIKIVTDDEVKNWDQNNAFRIVKDSLIANNNKIDAILAPNDPTAGAAIKALQEQDLAGKVAVTGQDADLDAVRRIVQRTQSMTVFKDTRELGKTAIDAAIKLANNENVDVNAYVNSGKIDVPSILITPITVDKNNIDDVLIKSGFYKKEDIYPSTTNDNTPTF